MAFDGTWRPQLNLLDGPTRQIVQSLQTYLGVNHPITICTSTTRPPNPQRGWAIFETDTGNVFVYYGSTTGWRPPWNVAWGELAYAQIASNFTAAVAIGDVTGLASLSVSLPASRIVAVEFEAVVTQATNASTNKVYLTDTANAFVGMYEDDSVAAGGRQLLFGRVRVVSAGGTFAYKIRANSSALTMTINAAAAGTEPGPAYYRFVDEGPSGNAPSA